MARETVVFRDNMQYADDAAFFAAWPDEERGQTTYGLIGFSVSSTGPRWTDGIKTVDMDLVPAGGVVDKSIAWVFRTRTITGLDPAKRYVVRAAFYMNANYPFGPRAGMEARGADGVLRRGYSLLAAGTDYLAGDLIQQWEILELINRPNGVGEMVIALGAWNVTGIMPRHTYWGLVEIAEITPGPADDFMLDPDGQFPVIESCAFLTDVIVGRSGSEVRRKIRSVPRLRQEFTVQRFSEDGSFLDAQLHGNLSGDWYVPWWLDQSPLTADVAAAATVIPAVHAGYRFVEGEELVVWQSRENYERRVVAVGGLATPGQITVTAGLTDPWTVASGTIVMPVKRCWLPEESHDVGRPASFVGSRPVVFEERR